mmetsp:Transcript_16136/g.31338  ORF Transcript_16136/g.31338 Transcript_16136/m.31338 type:complete len:91 (+) Transcript_16136:79-351(+)
MSANEHAQLSDPLPNGGSRHSILSGKSGRLSRMDSFGNAIEKGAKGHRLHITNFESTRKIVSSWETDLITDQSNSAQPRLGGFCFSERKR